MTNIDPLAAITSIVSRTRPYTPCSMAEAERRLKSFRRASRSNDQRSPCPKRIGTDSAKLDAIYPSRRMRVPLGSTTSADVVNFLQPSDSQARSSDSSATPRVLMWTESTCSGWSTCYRQLIVAEVMTS
jgi:hypothetical protein